MAFQIHPIPPSIVEISLSNCHTFTTLGGDSWRKFLPIFANLLNNNNRFLFVIFIFAIPYHLQCLCVIYQNLSYDILSLTLFFYSFRFHSNHFEFSSNIASPWCNGRNFCHGWRQGWRTQPYTCRHGWNFWRCTTP